MILVAPATANVIAKMAHGIADDMLTTVLLAARCPAGGPCHEHRHAGKPHHPGQPGHLAALWDHGDPLGERYACLQGCGQRPAAQRGRYSLDYILQQIAKPKDMQGLRVAVTAGPTQEALDPVRYLTNHSTGKMGYALAKAAVQRGAQVTLIHGPTALPPVRFAQDLPVTTAQQMFEAVDGAFDSLDVLVMAAAVADYRPVSVAEHKIKNRTAT